MLVVCQRVPHYLLNEFDFGTPICRPDQTPIYTILKENVVSFKKV
jgi:hypothetical protein